MTQLKTLAAAAVFALSASVASASPFSITVNYTGDAAFQSFFDDAVTSLTSWLTGRQTVDNVGPLVINASVEAIDGAGGILGQAGPTGSLITSDGFGYITEGLMRFDSADISSLVSGGLFDDVVRHEMLHTFGFGTAWNFYGVYVDGTGEYTGQYGLAAYQAEFNPNATFVPVELDGGPGTADAHWDEDDFENDSATFTNEIGSGFLNGPTYLSNTTQQSFRDIGYEVNGVGAGPVISPVPLPAGGVLILTAFAGMAALGRRRKAA